MTEKTASVTLSGEHMRLVGRTSSGHRLVLDDSAGDAGPRPSELIPLALAGCTAMDVISILRKKRQAITHYEVRASGVQCDEPPNVFTRIDVVHEIQGAAVDIEAVRRAVTLSATRYCAVGSTLSAGRTEIHHAFIVSDGHGERRTGDVVVLGPGGRVETMEPVAAV